MSDDLRNARPHGSPVFWSAPFAAVGNLPTSWSVGSFRSLMWWSNAADINVRYDWLFESSARPVVDADRDAEPSSLDPDRLEPIRPPAPEAAVGELDGADRVPAGTDDEGDGHRDSVAPVGPDGTWHPDLVGVAVAVGMSCDPYEVLRCRGGCAGARPTADVFTRDRVRLRVVLREPVEKYALVWRKDVAGFRAGGRRE